MSETKDTVELDENYIMFPIPVDSVKLKITATLLDEDGEPYNVMKTLSVQDIFSAREDFKEYIGDDFDGVYYITEAGKAWLDDMEKCSDD